MQALSLAWAILAVMGMVVAFIPCLGWVNYFNIPFAIAGLIVSVIAYASGDPRNRNNSLIAIILCLAAILLGWKRLVLGHFFF
jgi:hypothetical protein